MDKQELGNIMHGLSDQSLINADRIEFNSPDFPQISESRDLTLLLAERVKSWKLEDGAALLTVEAMYIDEAYTYRYFDYRQVFQEKKIRSTLTVRIQFVYDDTVRVTMKQGFECPPVMTEMIDGHAPFSTNIEVVEFEDRLILANGKIEVHIDKNPWNLKIVSDGENIYQQFGKDNHSFMTYEICPFGFLYDKAKGEIYSTESIRLNPYEKIYGLGESFTGFNRRGRSFSLWNTNALGVNTKRSYKNIPFFHSTGGYGLFINSSQKIHVDCGNRLSKGIEVLVADDTLDCFIIAGKEIASHMPSYFALTGMPKMPPKWSFGLWLGKISYRSADEVLQVASRLREEKIPCDVIHIDTDWFAENWVCDWQFDKDRFPDVSGMIENLHEEGFKISLWQLPYIERGNISTEVYDEGLAKGYFASLPNGDMKYPHGLIDFSNPEAVHWYKNKLLRPLLEQGIDVIKVDFGESAPAEFKYAGISGSEMHNLYSLLYNKAAYEATLDVKGEENAMIWARSAWAGSQRYPMHWGGDAGTDYSSLASSLQGCLSLSVSGMPFWSSDVGGFWFMPSPDLYVRWVQFGVFCSHMRLHGFYTREPWDFGEEALGIVRKYINLRYQLLPYIFRQALDTTKTGVLFHRPMAYDYPQDPTTASIDTQYMFGESLLVAPIVNEDGICEIYLPQGLWTDFFTEEQIEGPVWLKRTYKLEEFPVFVKENSVIPMDIVHQCIDESHKSEKTLHIYFANTTQRIEYQDESFDITVSSHSDCCIKIDVSGDFDTLELVVHGITAKNIKSNQASVPFENRDSLIQLKMTNNTPSIIIETENEEA